MDSYDFIYVKKRKEFGRYCQFDDVEPKILGAVEENRTCGEMYVEKTINDVVLDNIPKFSEHSVNTAKVKMQSTVMLHVEGGWPKDIEYTEHQETTKFVRRLEKDPAFTQAVKQLTLQTQKCLEQNRTIDLFEHYFHQEEPEHLPESLTMKTQALFKDPSDEKRSVTKIGWHPEGGSNLKLVCSYSNLRFQRMTDEMPMNSFIWDIAERNVPLTELRTSSPMVCCQYNTRNPDWLVGGCYNGLLNWFDLRKGPAPAAKSAVESSHWDPVYDVVWMQSKTNSECCSVSSDGRLMFWDVRNLSEVVDECALTDGGKEPKTFGGVSLEWMQDAGPKFLVGTEHGIIINCQRKPKKSVEVAGWYGQEDKGGFGRHFGPVYAVKRNPAHVKNFLSVGDWCCKMWNEELKGPMLQTPFYPSYISAAAWSPTRPGVFFLTRHDGRLECWDYFYRMNEAALSQKVSDAALTSLSMQPAPSGQLAAVGDCEGVVTLLRLCDALVHGVQSEKSVVGQIFDREAKREKNLEAIKKQSGKGGGAKEEKVRGTITIDRAEYEEREKAFFNDVGMSGEDLGTKLTDVKGVSKPAAVKT